MPLPVRCPHRTDCVCAVAQTARMEALEKKIEGIAMKL